MEIRADPDSIGSCYNTYWLGFYKAERTLRKGRFKVFFFVFFSKRILFCLPIQVLNNLFRVRRNSYPELVKTLFYRSDMRNGSDQIRICNTDDFIGTGNAG